MYAKTPVYFHFAEYAKEKNELGLWQESYNINKDLKSYLENNALNFYNTYRLQELVETLAENYGVGRSMYLIARTIQFRGSCDGRYSRSVRDCADTFSFPDEYTEAAQEANKRGYEDIADKSRAYVSDVHSTILNGIFHELMKLKQKQEQEHKEISEKLGGVPLG